MNKSRRIGALVAAGIASVGMSALVAPTAAEASPRGPQPVSNFVQRVRAHTDTWVGIRWQTDRRICDAKVWVNGRRVDVDYPRNARSTSFSRSDSLRPGRGDVTAFRVNADFDRSGVALLRATIAYDNCGRHARTFRKSFGIAMPVVAFRPGNGHWNNDRDKDDNGHGNNGHWNNDKDKDDNGHGNNGHWNNNRDNGHDADRDKGQGNDGPRTTGSPRPASSPTTSPSPVPAV
jgi:hypothetical protein